MRTTMKLLVIAWALGAQAAYAAASKTNEWLIRTSLAAPTAAELSSRLGVAVERVVPVDGDLYKIVTAPAGPAEVDLKAVLSEREDGVVTSVQRNFVYRPMIELPAAESLPAAVLRQRGVMELAADNPAIEPPNGAPARGADPKAADQWGLGKTSARQAWGVTRGSRDIIVAVIDTGIDYNHEDLRDNLWRNPREIPANGVDDDENGFVDDVLGWDFADNDALPFDKMSAMRFDGNPGHGTHCAGVVGAAGDNAIGIAGIAPEISIMGLRFITDAGQGTTEDAIKAIRYAVANGAKVISNSWGGEAGEEDDTELKIAIQEAQDAGVLLIFAAGNGRAGVGFDNDSDGKPMVPASFDHDAIVSVAATDSVDALGPFSNFGPRTTDLAAPGVRVMSSVPGNAYEDRITFFGIPLADWSGTSMAAPHVAGAAALVWSQHPHLTAAEVKERLLSTVTPITGLNGKVGSGGVLNVHGAVQ